MRLDKDLSKFLLDITDKVHSDASDNFIQIKKNRVKIRIRVLDVLFCLNVVLHYKVDGITYSKLMKPESDSIFYKTVPFDSDRISYYFEIFDSRFCVYLSKTGIGLDIPLKSSHFSKMKTNSYPSWLCSSVLYQIFVDRYQTSSNDLRGKHPKPTKVKKKLVHEVPDSYNKSKCMDFYGGNLLGVIDRVPYLKDLGITTLYFNPIFEALTHHAYDCIDYTKVANCFGGNETLVELSSQLEQNEMDYILDISINHTGNQHKWLNNENTKQYYLTNDLGVHKNWEGASNLFTLDYRNETLKNEIYISDTSILKTWLRAPYNCRGFRFDVGHSLARDQDYFDHFELWRELRYELKSLGEDKLILAEYWDDASNYLKGDLWDSVTNYYGFLIPLRKFLGLNLDARNEKKFKFNSRILVSTLQNSLNEISFQQSLIQVNMLGTHDISRLYNHKEINQDIYFKLACMLLTYIGVPCLYYGDEILLDGTTKTNEGYRYPMDWNSEQFSGEYFIKLKKMIQLRREQITLQKGSIYFLETCDGIVSYLRKLDDRIFFIWLNFNGQSSDLTLNIPILGDTEELQVKSVLNPDQNLVLKRKTQISTNQVICGVYSN